MTKKNQRKTDFDKISEGKNESSKRTPTVSGKRKDEKKTPSLMGTATALGAASATGAIAALAMGASAATVGPALIPVAAGSMMAGLLAQTLVEKYISLPINKKIAPVKPVSDIWKNRPKANLVKWLMKQSGTSLEKVASYIGCSVSYLNNKLTRECFSFEDLILAAYACGYTFVVVKNNEEVDIPESYRVDMLQHFQYSDPSTLERINTIEEKIHNEQRAEYEKKKAELERMKIEYGIED